jgi:hypothetical protein
VVEAAFILVIFFALVILFGIEENERKILMEIKRRFLTSHVQGSSCSKK